MSNPGYRRPSGGHMLIGGGSSVQTSSNTWAISQGSLQTKDNVTSARQNVSTCRDHIVIMTSSIKTHSAAAAAHCVQCARAVVQLLEWWTHKLCVLFVTSAIISQATYEKLNLLDVRVS